MERLRSSNGSLGVYGGKCFSGDVRVPAREIVVYDCGSSWGENFRPFRGLRPSGYLLQDGVGDDANAS